MGRFDGGAGHHQAAGKPRQAASKAEEHHMIPTSTMRSDSRSPRVHEKIRLCPVSCVWCVCTLPLAQAVLHPPTCCGSGRSTGARRIGTYGRVAHKKSLIWAQTLLCRTPATSPDRQTKQSATSTAPLAMGDARRPWTTLDSAGWRAGWRWTALHQAARRLIGLGNAGRRLTTLDDAGRRQQ